MTSKSKKRPGGPSSKPKFSANRRPSEARRGRVTERSSSSTESDSTEAPAARLRPRRAPASSKPSEQGAPTLSRVPRRKKVSSPVSSTPPPPPPEETETEKLPLQSLPVPPFPENETESEILPADSTSEDIGMLGIGSRVYPPGMDFELFEEAQSYDLPAFNEETSVEDQIREIEERLNSLMTGAELASLPPSLSSEDAEPENAEEAVDAARELLESTYYRKKWGRGALRQQSEGVDDFGLDPNFEKRLRPGLEFLFQRYFRVEVEGIQNIPSRGRGIVVANHSGLLPFDGAMLREAARLHHPAQRDLRWLAEDFSFYLPFIGVTMNRIGAVRACQENAQRLLEREHVVAVFPEGAEGLKKLYHERYQLQRFGRGGFIRLALKTKSPIIPCAIIGAEETNPILYRFDNLSKLIGLDYLPVTLTFPFLGPLGLLPAPTKWRILFGEPIEVKEYGPSAANDHVLVGQLSEKVRTEIQALIDTGLRRRRSLWF